MKFGLNLLVLSDTIGPKVLRRFGALREIGFDGVEIPIFNPPAIAVDRIRQQADKYGLALTCSGALPPGTRFYGRAAAPRKAAARYVRDTLRVTAALGSTILCGPLGKPVGDRDESLPFARQRAETARALQPLLAEADALGVTVAFEPLNRFETNLLNTVDQGIGFCRTAGHPRAGLLLDTFHMHTEEKDSPAAIAAAARAGVLTHFHASENDRGIAGTGQVAWPAVSRALRAAGYDGWVVLESFAQDNQAIKTAVSCWRPFFPSWPAFCRQGLAFAKRRFR
jgi:D-psicose/D-tagatose/L-ribulose 3-epimerase